MVMEYELIRSKRKTISLKIESNGKILVRAPYYLAKEKIDEFVSSKSQWIEKHTSACYEKSKSKSSRLALPPTELPLLGEMYPVDNAQPYGCTDGCFHLPENMTLEELLPYLKKLYTAIAKNSLISRTYYLAQKLGIEITTVKINSARTRWGSCSSQRVINLSWKLILAAPPLIDYVIVHELCHTRHMDHSPAFWADVAQVIPDYLEKRDSLRSVQALIYEYSLE